MNERIREENMEGVHLEMHLETHAAQCNALEYALFWVSHL